MYTSEGLGLACRGEPDEHVSRGRSCSGVPLSLLRVLTVFVVVLSVKPVPAVHADTLTVCENGSCDYTTIQDAVGAAFSGDTISLLDEVFTESGILVDKNVIIVGGNTAGTIIQAAEAEGEATDRVLEISSDAEVILEDVTVRHGNVEASPARGGGILNYGSLTLKHVTVEANRAVGLPGDPGGLAEGGGIYTQGDLQIVASTISANLSQGGKGDIGNDDGGDGEGGGLKAAGGTVRLANSTVSGNTAQGGAGCGG